MIQLVASLVQYFHFLKGGASKVLDQGRFSGAGNSDQKDNYIFFSELFDLCISLFDKLSELFDVKWLELPHYFSKL